MIIYCKVYIEGIKVHIQTCHVFLFLSVFRILWMVPIYALNAVSKNVRYCIVNSILVLRLKFSDPYMKGIFVHNQEKLKRIFLSEKVTIF